MDFVLCMRHHILCNALKGKIFPLCQRKDYSIAYEYGNIAKWAIKYVLLTGHITKIRVTFIDFLGGRLVNFVPWLHRLCNKYMSVYLRPAHCLCVISIKQLYHSNHRTERTMLMYAIDIWNQIRFCETHPYNHAI
jgi:hypothetical protein